MLPILIHPVPTRRSSDLAGLAAPKSRPRTACSAIWIGASQAARSASGTLSASCEAQWKVSRMSAIVGFSRAFAETLEQDRQQNERQDRKSTRLNSSH